MDRRINFKLNRQRPWRRRQMNCTINLYMRCNKSIRTLASTYLYIVRNNIPFNTKRTISSTYVCDTVCMRCIWVGLLMSVYVQYKSQMYTRLTYTEIENKAGIFRLSTVPGVVVVFTFVYVINV